MKNKNYYIDKIEYFSKDRTLELTWSIDVVWNFFEVPESVYLSLAGAQNKEEYYRENVMNAYSHRQKWRNAKELLKICADILFIQEKNVSVNSRSLSNELPIHLVSFWGDVEAIRLLASMGSEIDSPGDCNCTPLYDAVSSGNIQAVEVLLELGASPFSINDLNYTPYELALETTNSDMINAFSSYI